MGTEVIVSGVAYTATVLAMTVFLWRVFGKRFDAMDARQEEFDRKLETMESKFDRRWDKVDGRLGAIEAGVGKLEGQFDGLRDRFGTLEGRFNTLDGKVDGLATDHRHLTSELAEFRREMHGRFGTFVPQSADEA